MPTSKLDDLLAGMKDHEVPFSAMLSYQQDESASWKATPGPGLGTAVIGLGDSPAEALETLAEEMMSA